MKTERLTNLIILACALVQIICGIVFTFDYTPLIAYGWTGSITTTLSFAIIGTIYSRSRNKGEIFDERFGLKWLGVFPIAYMITAIGIALTIKSVFYDAKSVSNNILIIDIAGIIMFGWGIPLLLFAFGVLNAGRIT